MNDNADETLGLSTKGIDLVYRAPEIVNQRLRTLTALALRPGEAVADIGCGNGLLTELLAQAVGPDGKVIALDHQAEMLEAAAETCAGRSQIEWQQGSATDLLIADASLDALACTQVLLYVADVEGALAEMRRVLKPGGRLAVLETDWRGTVFNATRDDLTRRILATWDAAVPSPNLPPRLGALLKDQGFAAIKVEAIPILNTAFAADNFSSNFMVDLADMARDKGTISADEATEYRADIEALAAKGAYFFCANRFLFTAVKV